MVLPKHRSLKYPEENPNRKCIAIVLMGILVLVIFFTGCTSSSGRPGNHGCPGYFPSSHQSCDCFGNESPEQVVTIIHYISLTKDLKDTELLFAIQVPVEWNVSTRRMDECTGNSGGLMYQTDLVKDDVFSLHTYSISNSQDQAYRDEFRKWSPAPAETTVTDQ